MAIQAILAGLGVVSTIIGANQASKEKKKQREATKEQGKSAETTAKFEASQMEQAAGQQQAIAQKAMGEELRRSELLQSRALAIAGASGAGVSDPTVMKLMSDLAAEGQLAAQTQKYNGDEAARALRVGAKIRRWEGKQARLGSLAAASAINSQIGAIRMQGILDVANTTASWYSGLPKDNTGKVTSWFGK